MKKHKVEVKTVAYVEARSKKEATRYLEYTISNCLEVNEIRQEE